MPYGRSNSRLAPDFKCWKDLLNEASVIGFSTCLTIIQVPGVENGQMAVVHARITMSDGRTFEDVGDADPANCENGALIRMAATRAKARCLRDALNVGEVADVELPDQQRKEYHDSQETRTSSPVSHLHGTMVCSNHQCRKQLTQGQYELSTKAFGQPLCPACQKLVQRVER